MYVCACMWERVRENRIMVIRRFYIWSWPHTPKQNKIYFKNVKSDTNFQTSYRQTGSQVSCWKDAAARVILLGGNLAVAQENSETGLKDKKVLSKKLLKRIGKVWMFLKIKQRLYLFLQLRGCILSLYLIVMHSQIPYNIVGKWHSIP